MELNRKTEESFLVINENNGLKEGMVKKANENKDLSRRIFGLEKKNLDLELELSLFRSTQKKEWKENKENRRKSFDVPLFGKSKAFP